MQICNATKFLRFAAAPVILTIIGVPAFVSARAQAKPTTAPAAPPVQLQTYTAPDQSASAGLPSGWKIISAAGGQINMSGPKGEAIYVDVYVAKDGAFQLGQKGPGVALMTMPSSAKLADKLTMFIQQQEAHAGSPGAQVKFLYAAPLQGPPPGVQCGQFVIAISGIATPLNGMGIFCSLPDDSAQLSKIVLFMGTAPSAIAAQTAPTVLAVFNSYKLAPGLIQKMFGPYTPPASGASPVPGGSPAQSAAAVNAYLEEIRELNRVSDIGATCTDVGIIGPSNWHQAAECNNW